MSCLIRRVGLIDLWTSCASCSFYKNRSCQAGVLNEFNNRGETQLDSNDNHVVRRVCQYRSHDDESLKEVKKRIFPILNYVVIHRNKDIKSIEKTLKSISKIQRLHDSNPKVIIATDGEVKELMSSCNSKFPKLPKTYIRLLDDRYEEFIFDEAFNRCQNGYILFIESGDSVDKNFLKTLDKAVNQKMLKVVAIPDINCYMAVLYKYLKGYSGADIKEKIEMMKSIYPDSSNTVYSMEKLNEVTSN